MFNRRDILGRGTQLGLQLCVGSLAIMSRPAFAADTPPLKVAHIMNTTGNATFVLQKLLEQQGYLEQCGLDATTVNADGATRLLGSILNGSQDISVLSGISPIFPAIEHGAKMKIIAGANLLPVQTIYSKKPDIKEVKDLVGKTIGVGQVGSLAHQLVVALLLKRGIDPSKVTFASIGSSADMFRATVAGTVDAAPGQIEVYKQQADYGVHSLVDANMWTEIPEHTYQGVFASDDAIANRRDILVRVLAAYAKLFRFIQSPQSQEAFVKARLAVVTSGDPKREREQAIDEWEFYQNAKPFAVDLTLSEDRIRYLQELNIKTGIQNKVLLFDQVADMSLAREALKMV